MKPVLDVHGLRGIDCRPGQGDRSHGAGEGTTISQQPRMQMLFHATWNLGGVRRQQLAKGLQEAQKAMGLRFDLVSLQEVPRAEPGWTYFEDETFSVYSHRDERTCRGTGICFRTSQWAVLRKKSDERGTWFRLRRISDGCQIWAGSVHLTQGSTKDLHATEIQSFVKQLPPTTLSTVVGMDVCDTY